LPIETSLMSSPLAVSIALFVLEQPIIKDMHMRIKYTLYMCLSF
jgi:hypothetical protein